MHVEDDPPQAVSVTDPEWAGPAQRPLSSLSFASLLLSIYNGDLLLGTATGFLVEHRSTTYLITNRHVVSGRHADSNDLLRQDAITPRRLEFALPLALGSTKVMTWQIADVPVVDSDGDALWLEHPEFGRLVDVAAIQMSEAILRGVRAWTYDPWDRGKFAIEVTNDLYIVGFPFGRAYSGALATWIRGSVASEPALNYIDDLPVFLIDSRTRQGASGSPVSIYHAGGAVAVDGGTAFLNGPMTQFVGVYSGRINAESDLGLVWRASAVRDIIERGVRNPV